MSDELNDMIQGFVEESHEAFDAIEKNQPTGKAREITSNRRTRPVDKVGRPTAARQRETQNLANQLNDVKTETKSCPRFTPENLEIAYRK